jgi:small-conductance mechanosensitive channel
VNAENGAKLLFTLVFVAVVVVLARLVVAAVLRLLRRHPNERVPFWTRQAINLATAAVLLVGLASIWFDDPARLATAMGLVTAGLAFALQKVVTAVAGYFVILRGKTFNVGDRIRMGGVRGDVVALGFTQTTIMEMGQPPPVQKDEPAMWVQSRQYTGRIVTVSNSTIFDEPVYNYTRELPYIWEEMSLPIPYDANRERVEQILLDAAGRHTADVRDIGEEALRELERRWRTTAASFAPRVYWRLTDSWLELTVRFVARDHGMRELKDALSRDVLHALDAAGIGLASTTFAVTAVPPLRVEVADGSGARAATPRAG